jgi:hypothetical protein
MTFDGTDDQTVNASDTRAFSFRPASDFPAIPEPFTSKKKKRKTKAAPKKPKKKLTKRETPEKTLNN